jgi:hypothetical protein
LLLLALAAAAPKPAPAPPPARPEDIAEQLGMLQFDANPAWSTPARSVLSRWAGPMRVFVFGRPVDKGDTWAALHALARPTGIAMRVVSEKEVVRSPPNVFVVADENLAGAFRGPLREMLRNAFLDDDRAAATFVRDVIDTQPCWVLPVWTDAGRTVLKSAVIGVDARGVRAETRACVLRGLGGALGLLGPGAFLRASAFAPGTVSRLSREDERMLRVLYGRAMRPGMGRDEALAAAQAALAPPLRKVPPKPGQKPKPNP